MKQQKLLSYLRKAVQDYYLIQENDVIAVGLSGGKDSLVLLYGLAKLKDFYPVPFDLMAISVDLGFGMDYSPMENFCRDLKVPFHLEKTQIKDIVFSARQETHPCSLCANMRRGALVETASQHGANKLALGHHRDDYLTTLMLSLIYEGRFYTFSPRYQYDHPSKFSMPSMDSIKQEDLPLVKHQKLSEKISVIRPLLYVPEAACRNFAEENHFPVLKNLCPEDHETRRAEMADLLQELGQRYPDLKDRLFHAFSTSQIPDWVYARKDPKEH